MARYSSRGMTAVALAAWLCLLLSSTVSGEPTPTPSPSPTPTPKPSTTPTPSLAPKPSPSPTPSPAPKPSPSPTPAPTPTPSPTPTSVPTIDTYAVPAPSAVAGSTTFAKVPNVQCDDIVSTASMQIYSNNRALFDKCVVEGEYQIFPFGGTAPNKAQITKMVRAESCRSVFTACVLANLPQCDIGGLALKSTAETLLKIAIDVQDNKHEAPDSAKFTELLKWRRDVNLAQAKGLPYDQNSQLYGEYSRNLWKALTNTTVRVAQNLTVSFDSTGVANKAKVNDMFPNVTGGSSRDDIVGKVKAPATGNGSVSFVNNATTKSGSLPRPTRSGVLGLVTAVTFVVGSLW